MTEARPFAEGYDENTPEVITTDGIIKARDFSYRNDEYMRKKQPNNPVAEISFAYKNQADGQNSVEIYFTKDDIDNLITLLLYMREEPRSRD